MEKPALNGTTTTATKDHEDWKKKKGYGPIIVAVSLALLLSLYAGGHIGSGTNLRHYKMKTKNAPAALSSSMSLVGTGTTSSDLKTLKIELDDDENIDVLLSGWLQAERRKGGSSAYCKKNTGYNCGAVFPPNGDTCGQKGCCCRDEDGTGMKYNTCDNAKGYAYRGCNSCMGNLACFQTSNINVGTSSCHGNGSCKYVSDSTIDNVSCHGYRACFKVNDSTIGGGSCLGDTVCHDMKNSIIGTDSCNGNGSPCGFVENVKIGNNSCNGGGFVCNKCKHDVPDNACNQGVTDDMDINGVCNYCM